MSTTGRKLGRWAGMRLARRLGKSVPFLGAVVSAALVGEAVRRKGWLGGVADAGLNAIPFVGALKNALEIIRGDLIPDRRSVSSSPDGSRRTPPP